MTEIEMLQSLGYEDIEHDGGDPGIEYYFATINGWKVEVKTQSSEWHDDTEVWERGIDCEDWEIVSYQDMKEVV